ncbi:MAG: PAS domain S-box protein [Polyangia bacterium]
MWHLSTPFHLRAGVHQTGARPVAEIYAHPNEATQDDLLLRDGRTFDRHSAPLILADGTCLGRVWNFRDVTKRRRSEEALRRSEQKYHTSFHAASVGQALVALDGRFLEVNAALGAMLGYEARELVGLTFNQITLAEDAEKGTSARDRLLSHDVEVERLEKRYQHKNGSTVWADVSVATLWDAMGRPEGFVTHVLDISGRKRMEAELRERETERQRMEMELRHAQKLEAIGQLAAGIAHEINTPAQFVGDSIHFLSDGFENARRVLGAYRQAVGALAAIPGHEALAGQMREVEERADLAYLEENGAAAFARAEEGISRIAAIVRAMKEFAHPDQRDKEPADINRALQATLTIAKNEYKYVADVETVLGDIPLVKCHLGDINQVFLNLLVNAAHAIFAVVGKSGKRGKIIARTVREGGDVRIDVTDTGCGIPNEIKDRIFDPFFTTKEVGRGTGQGLAIARSIVATKHQGSLTFESEVGKGTTFTVRLPVDIDGSAGVNSQT